ncbi:hypothetical protein [Nocardioides cavernae]|uniref:hypothetical protein n=1 Tax=Nocardioides cavernae TaxID=1921566 RepID=UPI001C538BC2|nr:hypothetical protein [Nocardioides cavernae]
MSQEARGLDPKDWVVTPNDITVDGQAHWWLFKPIKSASYRRFDDWSEKMAAELAVLIGLPAAQVELARGLEDTGIISRNVTPNGWSMESGDTLLSEYEGYVSCALDERPRNRIGHNLANIAQVLADSAGPPGSGCESRTGIDVFSGYLVFDAWIANTDRHAINWGMLTCEEDGRQALAASFDHGSALASGTQDERLETTTPTRYAERGFAGRFEDGARLPLVDLALSAVQLAGPSADDWLHRLSLVTRSQVEEIVSAIPSMSDPRRTFLCNLLETNQRRLTP